MAAAVSLSDLDLAKVGPCPGCGRPVRRMGSVPISGTGLDLHFADKSWCRQCLQAKTDAAVEGIDREAIERGCIVDRSRVERPGSTSTDGRLL